MPIVVKQGELVMQTTGRSGVELLLQGDQSLLKASVARGGKRGGGKAFKCHSSLINLSHLVLAKLPHGSAAKLFDCDQSLDFEATQCLANLAAADATVTNQIRFNQPLSRHQPAVADALTNPGCNFKRRRGLGGLDGLTHV